MTQEEQTKRLVESLERLSQAWRSMGQTVGTLCESLKKLHRTTGREDGVRNVIKVV